MLAVRLLGGARLAGEARNVAIGEEGCKGEVLPLRMGQPECAEARRGRSAMAPWGRKAAGLRAEAGFI